MRKIDHYAKMDGTADREPWKSLNPAGVAEFAARCVVIWE